MKGKEKEIEMNAIYQFELKSLELLDVGSSEATDDEIEYINRQPNLFMKIIRKMEFYVNQVRGRDWKNQKYRRGPQVEKDISLFFPSEDIVYR